MLLWATDDELAVGALKFALQSGIEIPKKMEVVGCNNSVLSISLLSRIVFG